MECACNCGCDAVVRVVGESGVASNVDFMHLSLAIRRPLAACLIIGGTRVDDMRARMFLVFVPNYRPTRGLPLLIHPVVHVLLLEPELH